MIERREFIGSAAMGLLAGCAPHLAAGGIMEEIFGIIGEMKAVPGRRGELAAILLAGTSNMPGNLLYVIAEDLTNPDAIWITEVWRTRTDHANSLKLASVQAAIAQGRPLIASFGTRAETRPVAYAG